MTPEQESHIRRIINQAHKLVMSTPGTHVAAAPWVANTLEMEVARLALELDGIETQGVARVVDLIQPSTRDLHCVGVCGLQFHTSNDEMVLRGRHRVSTWREIALQNPPTRSPGAWELRDFSEDQLGQDAPVDTFARQLSLASSYFENFEAQLTQWAGELSSRGQQEQLDTKTPLGKGVRISRRV